MMRIRNTAIMAFRRFFHDEGFLLIDTPILTGSIGESAGTLFEVPYFDLGTAYLAQTGQLYLEAACMAYGRVYNFGPTFRAEKSKTRRHLTEFWMLEAEVAYADNEDNMRLQERMVSAVVAAVLTDHRDDLTVLERDTAPLEKVTVPFDRLDYGEAVKILQAKGSAHPVGRRPRRRGRDHPHEDARAARLRDQLSEEGQGLLHEGEPRQPRHGAVRGPARARGVRGDHRRLAARGRPREAARTGSSEEKLPEETYGWYLDLRKYGSVPHSGYGIGLERTLAWICGVQHIRECIPFPRTISRIYP